VSAVPISRYDGSAAGRPTGQQVRITADRVRRWEFEHTSFGRRGYDQRDVDRFRMQVADELDHLASRVADLRAENERLNDHVELHRHGVIPSAQPQLPGPKEVNLLSAAQREAEQIIAQAHDYARRVAEYARVQYESYVRAAVDDARQEAERAVQDYRSSAGTDFDGAVATREALRIYGEMMISHMQAAARHLDDGSEHLARTMDRLAVQGEAAIAGGGGSRSALPQEGMRHPGAAAVY
jgi:cell division septum initiation protein DivIVA